MKRFAFLSLALGAFLGLSACGNMDPDIDTVQSELIGSGTVIHIGDSYSAGVGLYPDESSYADSTCWRDNTYTPAARVAASRGGRLINKSCIGGYAEDTIPEQFRQAMPAGSDGTNTLIVLTAGGNDVRTKRDEEWPSLVKRCILKLSFTGCNREDANQVGNWADVGSKLDDLYDLIASKAPKANVRVLGYPRMMQPDSFWGCPGVTGIGTGEGRWFDSQVDMLNATISAAVARARTHALTSGSSMSPATLPTVELADGGVRIDWSTTASARCLIRASRRSTPAPKAGTLTTARSRLACSRPAPAESLQPVRRTQL